MHAHTEQNGLLFEGGLAANVCIYLKSYIQFLFTWPWPWLDDLDIAFLLRSNVYICRKFKLVVFQGSVATCLRWGGHCSIGFVANFIRFPAVHKFWKSVKIWQSYGEFKGGNFFETQCRIFTCTFSHPHMTFVLLWPWPCPICCSCVSDLDPIILTLRTWCRYFGDVSKYKKWSLYRSRFSIIWARTLHTHTHTQTGATEYITTPHWRSVKLQIKVNIIIMYYE